MSIRTVLAGLLAVAAVASAQPPARGRGWMGGPPPDGGGFMGAQPGRPGPVVKNAPYAADIVTETTRALPDGNRIHQTVTAHFCRDSEGRTRREQSLGGLSGLAIAAGQRQVVTINDPVAAVNYALDPAAKTGTRSVAGQWRAGRMQPGANTRAPGSSPRRPADQAALPPRMHGAAADRNVKTESLGRQTIEGVPADGTRNTITIPAGQMGNEQPIQIVTETWYSPDLQTNVLFKRTDPFSGETVTRVSNISRNEPAPSLFQVPADYQITDGPGPGPRPGMPGGPRR